MKLQRGQVVRSKAGRDQGGFMAVVQAEEKWAWVCDGKERPVSRPKRKNRRHLAYTNTLLPEEALATDRKLRAALRMLNESAEASGGEIETNEGTGDDPGTAV